MNNYEKDIADCIKTSLSRFESNVFEDLCNLFINYFEKSCNNMVELKKRTQKSKGTCFEIFCKLYLIEKGFECWMLNELDENIRRELNLCKQDVGIDLIAKKNGFYYPVQCKFRKPTKDFKGRQVHRVVWRDLSTFLSLCQRTGGKDGWKKHVIMTNADYCCWKGKKSEKDFTIGKKTFQNLDRNFWYDMVYDKSPSLKEQNVIPDISVAEKKEAGVTRNAKDLRQAWLDKILKNK
jgi:hypothetical protein